MVSVKETVFLILIRRGGDRRRLLPILHSVEIGGAYPHCAVPHLIRVVDERTPLLLRVGHADYLGFPLRLEDRLLGE